MESAQIVDQGVEVYVMNRERRASPSSRLTTGLMDAMLGRVIRANGRSFVIFVGV